MACLPRGLVAVDVGDDEAAGGGHDKNHSSPENCEEGAWTEFGCWRVERFLVHGIAALNDIGSGRSCVVSNSISLGKRFRNLKYIFEIPDGSLVWPAIPF